MTPTGRVPLLLMVGVLPIVLRPDVSTMWLWIGVVIVVVTIDWLLTAQPTQLTITRPAIPSVRLGERAETEVVVVNQGPKAIRAILRDAWQPSASAGSNRHRVTLKRDEHTSFRTPLHAQRRGSLRARQVTVRSFGPLGLAARQKSWVVPGLLRCLPKFDSRKELPSRLAQLQELDGRSAIRVRGVGTEFDSLREYVSGDDVRSIDWRASARSTQVVVRTWQPERDRRVVLVLDTSRTSAGRIGDVPKLDAAMDAAQLITAVAGKAGDRVDFLAGDQALRCRLRLSNRPGELAQSLADLEPVIVEANWELLSAAILQTSRRRALVVLLTPLESSAIEESLLPSLPVLLRHHQVVIASVRDPALKNLTATTGSVKDSIELYQRAAGYRELTRRKATAQMLQTLGVRVLDTDAETLPTRLVDLYLELKRAGLL